MKQLARSASVTCAMENALQEGHCVRNRWQVIKKIGQGAFGEVYHCKDRKDGSQVAIKIFSKEKDTTTANQLLKLEVSVLRALQGENYFPKFVAFGKTMRFDYLAMELLGPSLSELRRRQPDRKFSLSTTLRLGEMMLKCIQALHRTGFVHRDIKPSNFVMGLGKNTRKVFLLDFGLSRQILLENGEMRPARPKASFQGTPRYASINVLTHKEAGRHDDLISLFYVLSEFAFQELPWKNLRELHDVAEAKDMYDHQIMVKEFPDGFQHYFHHVKDLTYCDVPNYELLYSVFDQCIKLRGVKETDPFDFELSDEVPFVELQKKGTSLTIQSEKTQSDVLIVKCDSIEMPEIIKERIQNMKPRNGLIENFGESNLTDCSQKKERKSIEKLNINSNNIDICEDIKFITPNGNDNQLKMLTPVNSDIKSAIPNHQKTTHTTQFTQSHQNESVLIDSNLPGNSSFEQKILKQKENFQLESNNLCQDMKNRATSPIGLTVPLEKLHLKSNKPNEKKHRHSVRRSVSQPACIFSNVKNVLNESDKSKKQKLFSRCRSCPVISFSIQSDLKPCLNHQVLFEENVDKVQNIAALKKVNSVHIDNRKNSLPIILTSSKNYDFVNEHKAHSESTISLQRYFVNKTSKYNNMDSMINFPNTSQSMKLNFCSVPDVEIGVKKSLSDSNISLQKSTKYLKTKIKRDTIECNKIICTEYLPERSSDHFDSCKHEKETNPGSLNGLNTPNYSLRKSSACDFENTHKLSSVNEEDCGISIVITNEISVGDNEMKNAPDACNETSFQKNENDSPQISALNETNISTDSRMKSSFSNVNDSLVKELPILDDPGDLANVPTSRNSSESSYKLSNSTPENILQSSKNEIPRKETASEEIALLNFKKSVKTDDNFRNNETFIPQESKSLKEMANPSLVNEDLSLSNSLNLSMNNQPQINILETLVKPTVCDDNMSSSESINKLSRSLSTNLQQSIGHVEQENASTSKTFLLDSKTCSETDNLLQNNEFIPLHASECDKKFKILTNPNEVISPNANDSSNLLQKAAESDKKCQILTNPNEIISPNVNDSSNLLQKASESNNKCKILTNPNEGISPNVNDSSNLLQKASESDKKCKILTNPNEGISPNVNDSSNLLQKASESDKKCKILTNPNEGISPNINDSSNLLQKECIDLNVPIIVINSTENENSNDQMNEISKHTPVNGVQCTENEASRDKLPSQHSILLDSETCNEMDTFQTNKPISRKSSESSSKCLNSDFSDDCLLSNETYPLKSSTDKDTESAVPDIVKSDTASESSISEPINKLSKSRSESIMNSPENITTLRRRQQKNSDDKYVKDEKELNDCLLSNENYPLKSSTDKHTESAVPDTVKSDTASESSISEPINKLSKSRSESIMNSTENITTLRRRQRENSDDKYVKDEKELNLNFTRRRQRPTSQIYEMSPPVLENHSQELSFPSASHYHKTESTQNVSSELLYPPPDDPPPNHCLPSRRSRYRRSLNYMTTTS